MSDCIFCKIVTGQIPAHTVCSSPHAVAFLDIAPLAEGHTLLVPRDHYATLDQMPAETLARVTELLPQLAQALLSVTGAAGYNLLQNNGQAAGQVVEHVHFHLIPRIAGDGLGYRWDAKSYAAGRADALRTLIQRALTGARPST